MSTRYGKLSHSCIVGWDLAAFVSIVENLQLLRCTSPMKASLCVQGGAYASVNCVTRSASIHNVHVKSHGSTYLHVRGIACHHHATSVGLPRLHLVPQLV